jgi:aminotransferase
MASLSPELQRQDEKAASPSGKALKIVKRSQHKPEATVQESIIRKMTRLAIQHGAVNLSQGFPNEAPPLKIRLALAHGVLTGQSMSGDDRIYQSLLELLQNEGLDDCQDELNQYSQPMGRPDVRLAISNHYKRLYDYDVSPEHNITVTLGATEAVASALRTLGRPGDTVVIFEPFHELYPSQCRIFYLEPTYVTLYPNQDKTKWTYDKNELEHALKQAQILLLNTPHNPTGKVFSHEELEHIVELCAKHKVYIVTDEIYEHMCYHDTQHHLIPHVFGEKARELTLVCNSMGKSASATGWRLGWCLHPSHVSDTYRGIHDQMAVMSPHPMQYASLTYFSLPDSYFRHELPTRYYDRVFGLAKVLSQCGFDVIPPDSSYYLFVNYRNVAVLQSMEPMEAAMHMIHHVGVACVPGDNFYGKALEQGQNYLRFAACRSKTDLEKACERLQSLHVN